MSKVQLTAAHDWTGHRIVPGQTGHFLSTDSGQHVFPRGVNLSAASKIPPFLPLKEDEIPQHLDRLKSWGFTFIRVNVTWEALADKPDSVNHDYIRYLKLLFNQMAVRGMIGYVSVHQDLFSRLAGGSGAPVWVLKALGINVPARDFLAGFAHTQDKEEQEWVELVHQTDAGVLASDQGGWPSGNQKYIPATLTTVFFAGSIFAPSFKAPNGEQIQTYLQDRFFKAFAILANELSDCEALLGMEPFNEPHEGYVNHDLSSWDYRRELIFGNSTTPLQSFALASGHSVDADYYERSWPFPTRKTKTVTLNSAKKVLLPVCPWQNEGVWAWDKKLQEPIILRENYFKSNPKTFKPVSWQKDCFNPFLLRWHQEVVSKIQRDRPISFISCLPFRIPTHPPKEIDSLVAAPHWYDLRMLFERQSTFVSANVFNLLAGKSLLLNLYFGVEGRRRNYINQLKAIRDGIRKSWGEKCTVVLGEVGVPMNLDSMSNTETECAVNNVMEALESTFMPFNWWCYNPSDTKELGDDWNGESLSIFCNESEEKPAKISTIYDGCKVTDALIRPYASRVPGLPLFQSFEISTRNFLFRWQTFEHNINIPTLEVFLPTNHYPSAELIRVTVKGGGTWTFDAALQTLQVDVSKCEAGTKHQLLVESMLPWTEATQQQEMYRALCVFGLLVAITLAIFFPELQALTSRILSFTLSRL